MRNEIPVRSLFFIFLALSALNLGCGGGAEVTSAPSENPSTSVRAGKQMLLPTLGYVYAAGGNVARAIHGVPGAATLSAPLTVPAGVTGLTFAPGQKYALAEQGEGASLGLVEFSAAGPGVLLQLTGATLQPEVIAFSPKGAAAVLYSAAEGQLQVWTGLPSNPKLARQVGSGELPGAVRLLALADDGVTLLEGTTSNGVYLVGSGGAEMLASVSDLGGIVFTPESNDALIFDHGAGALSLLHDVSGAHSTSVLAQGLTGLGGNISLQTDGRRAVITASSASQLWAIDLESQALQAVQLPTTPALLQPLRVPGHYLLAWEPGQPAWILNTNLEKGTVYFVPAAAELDAAARVR